MGLGGRGEGNEVLRRREHPIYLLNQLPTRLHDTLDPHAIHRKLLPLPHQKVHAAHIQHHIMDILHRILHPIRIDTMEILQLFTGLPNHILSDLLKLHILVLFEVLAFGHAHHDVLISHDQDVTLETVDADEGLVLGWEAEELEGEHVDRTEEAVLVDHSEQLFVGLHQQNTPEAVDGPDVVHYVGLGELLCGAIVKQHEQLYIVRPDHDDIRQVFPVDSLPVHTFGVCVQLDSLNTVGHPVLDEAAVVDIEEFTIPFGILFIHP